MGDECSASPQSSLVAASHDLACMSCRALVPWLQGLLQLGAQLDARDKGGATPLFQSCEAGHATCTKVLLAAGADAQLSNAAGVLVGAWHDCPALLVLQAAGASPQLSSVAGDPAALPGWVCGLQGHPFQLTCAAECQSASQQKQLLPGYQAIHASPRSQGLKGVPCLAPVCRGGAVVHCCTAREWPCGVPAAQPLPLERHSLAGEAVWPAAQRHLSGKPSVL